MCHEVFMRGLRRTLEEGGWGRQQPALPAPCVGVGCCLVKTAACIQVTSPARQSGQLSHGAVNYIRKERFVRCGYVFSLLKLVLKTE